MNTSKTLTQKLIRAITVIALSASLLMLTLSNTGCGGEGGPEGGAIREIKPSYTTREVGGLVVPDQDKTYEAVVIIVGNTANQPQPTLSDDVVGYLTQALLAETTPAIISAAGVSKHESIAFEQPSGTLKSNGNERANRSALNQWITNIETAINTDPGKDHLDVLGAIKSAIATLRSVSGNKLLIIVGSGLSDAGLLNFAADPSLINTSPDELAAKLLDPEAGNGITSSSLENCDVVLSGLGWAVEPQYTLQPDGTKDSIDNLEAIYRVLIESMGASANVDNKRPSVETSVSTEHTVSPTKFLTNEIIDEAIENNEPIDLSSAIVDFVPDTADFSDRAAAIEALTPIVQKLEQADKKIEVIGYQAKPPQVPLSDLPGKRAQAVCDLLLELGLDPVRIAGVHNGGAGQDRPGGAKEYDENGNWNSELAQPNRVVVLDPVP